MHKQKPTSPHVALRNRIHSTLVNEMQRGIDEALKRIFYFCLHTSSGQNRHGAQFVRKALGKGSLLRCKSGTGFWCLRTVGAHVRDNDYQGSILFNAIH